ncbi:MAG: hypothetical protein R2818_04425 [Flavobacteriales bacterium]
MDDSFSTGGTVSRWWGRWQRQFRRHAKRWQILVAGSYGEIFGADFAVARFTSGLADGILEATLTQEIAVYPNPATERICIGTAAQGRSVVLEVFNAEGARGATAAHGRCPCPAGCAWLGGRALCGTRAMRMRYVGAFVKGR